MCSPAPPAFLQTACELCGVTFQFNPVYAPGAPASPRPLDRLAGALGVLAASLPQLARTTAVVAIWGGLAPLVTVMAYCGGTHGPWVSLSYFASRWARSAVLRDDWSTGVLLLAFVLVVVMLFAPLLNFVHTAITHAAQVSDRVCAHTQAGCVDGYGTCAGCSRWLLAARQLNPHPNQPCAAARLRTASCFFLVATCSCCGTAR